MSQRLWTAEEHALLTSHPDWPDAQLAEALGRTVKAIRHKRQGVIGKQGRVALRWTEEDLAFLADHPGLTARQIGERLGRSRGTVKAKRRQIALGWAEELAAWTEEDSDFVRQTPHLTLDEVAAQLGRTISSVKNRRAMLTSQEGLRFGRNRWPTCGSRRMLARTCYKCGLLLGAEWFNQSHRSRENRDEWTAQCTRCRPRGHSTRPGERRSKANLKLQALTVERATRVTFPWLESDHEVLRDPELLLVEKALLLSRTYYGVAHATKKFGYQSKTGLGDQTKGQWVIDNPNLARVLAQLANSEVAA